MQEVNPHGFASDNCSGVHPDILRAMTEANHGHVLAYGVDIYCQRATAKIQEIFGDDVLPFVVFNGTAANVMALQAITHRHNAIICAQTAHINVDECGAPERITGCKLLTVPTPDGKLTPDLIEPRLQGIGDQHHSQPSVISISQPTELGTIYSLYELRALSAFAKQHNMLIHMDGARLANAAATLGLSLREITADVGIDVLSFGGIKNGMMYGEMIVFFDYRLGRDFQYTRKQGLQLTSKMRFIAAQWEAYLSNEQYLKTARHANLMAQKLAERVAALPQIRISQAVQSNAVFAVVPRHIIEPLQRDFYFYVWDELRDEVRWMTSWDTTEADIDQFISRIEELLA